MEYIMSLMYKIATYRYLLWRLSGKMFLGKIFGSGLGQKVVRDIDEACGNSFFSSYVLSRHVLAKSYIQNYNFEDFFPVEFPREEIFRQRNVYLLKDVVLGPKYGGIWIPNAYFFQQSIGSIRRANTNNSISENLLPVKSMCIDEPVISIGVASHYHMLIESLPLLLHALKFYPNLKILLPEKFPKYLYWVLESLKIDSSRIIISDKPIKVKKAILVPKHENSGFVNKDDIEVLKSFFDKFIDINSSKYPERIYISRARSVNRRLECENELENELKKLNFSVLYFEELSLQEQFNYIYHAKFIVAPHGAGLANIIMGNPGTKILEILSRNWFNTCYAKLAVQNGFEYYYKETKLHNKKIVIDVEDVIEQVKKMV